MTQIRTSPPKAGEFTLLFMVGPIVWFIHFMAIYLLADLGCQAGIGLSRISGLDALKVLVILATVIGALLTVGSAVRSFRYWQRNKDMESEAQREAKRRHFMSYVSFLSNLFFTTVMVVTALPVFFLSSCGGIGV